jgi:hypothetical protein
VRFVFWRPTNQPRRSFYYLIYVDSSRLCPGDEACRNIIGCIFHCQSNRALNTMLIKSTADVEVIPIQKVNEAYDRLSKADVKYRFSIDMTSLKSQ